MLEQSVVQNGLPEMVRCLECGLVAMKGIAGLCSDCSRGLEWDESDDYPGGLSLDNPLSPIPEDREGFVCLGGRGFQWVPTPPFPKGRVPVSDDPDISPDWEA